MLEILFEDNHLLIINKKCGELCQSDKTNDETILDKAKNYLKIKYKKKGKVFLGLNHRIDRPTSGIVILSKTSKSLTRMNESFKKKKVSKVYWAIVNLFNKKNGEIVNFLKKNKQQNKSYIVNSEIKGSKHAMLRYTKLLDLNKYSLLEIKLLTGRHHQIRAQLSNIGFPVKGDLKYGFPRSNKDKGIHLHAREVEFIHPTTKKNIKIKAPPPSEIIWDCCLKSIET